MAVTSAAVESGREHPNLNDDLDMLVFHHFLAPLSSTYFRILINTFINSNLSSLYCLLSLRLT